MRLYRITVADSTINWAGTQAEAKQLTKEAGPQFIGEQPKWVEEDVPTDKEHLLAWLRSNAVGFDVGATDYRDATEGNG